MAASRPLRWVLLGRVPPPIDGQTLATQRLLQLLAPEVAFDVVDSSGRDGRHIRAGTLDRRRLAEVRDYFASARRAVRAHPGPILYANLSGSTLGHLRDIACFASCIPRHRAVIAWPHNDLARLRRHPLLRQSFGRLARRVDRWVFLNRALADAVGGLVAADRVATIPNAIDDALVVSAAEVDGKLAAARPERELRVLFVANMEESKGFGELLGAVAVLKARGVPFRLTFAGGWFRPDDPSRFGRRVAELGVEAETMHVGPVRERAALRSLYLDHHVFALPTRNDAQPLTILEAMNAGCAVVSTRRGGIPEMVEDGVAGRLVPVQDAGALAEALAAYREPNLWRAHGRAARAAFDRGYAAEIVRRRWLEVVRGVGEEAGGRHAA